MSQGVPGVSNGFMCFTGAFYGVSGGLMVLIQKESKEFQWVSEVIQGNLKIISGSLWGIYGYLRWSEVVSGACQGISRGLRGNPVGLRDVIGCSG